jgi:hypothetical protein
VNGYRLVQPASDMFLGWSQGARGRHYFVRQLRDMKITIMVLLLAAAVVRFLVPRGAWVFVVVVGGQGF